MRIREYVVFLYRIFLVYLFYAIARGLFFAFNTDFMGEPANILLFLKLSFYGLQFDTAAICYVNLLFILLSLLPLRINTKPTYQKTLFYVYFITNGLAYLTNFIDVLYYPYSKSRLTSASYAVIENEQNKMVLLFNFLGMYWYVVLLFIFLIWLWIFLYKKVKVTEQHLPTKPYFITSVLVFVLVGLGVLTGIRGGTLEHSSRPINIVDASRHTNITGQADAILNTPFTLIRTLGKNKGFKEYHFVDEAYINESLKPIKQYNREVATKPNVVLFILESFGKEYWGCMNTKTNIPNFKSYTPFLDSLSVHSFVLDNAYCTGRQSIHGMSSMLAGIPTMQVAYTSSPFAQQKVQSIVSIAKEMGYDTSFFHSAPNGSMGFLGFSNILGFDHYYGKNEYNNDADDDGHWGIWDEPFFQYMCRTYSQKKQPFLGTIFTLSSHHPFQIPKQYEGKFPKGNLEIHQCIGYTDYALKQFFECAKKQPWYNNTIFAFVNDHPNQIYYDLYKEPITGKGAAIMFYSPNPNLVPKGINSDITQQIDIYPSLVDLMGYHKPFRSWGRSVFANLPDETPRAFISDALMYQMMQGNYIYIIDETGKVNGVYKKEDGALKNNLLGKEDNAEIQKGIKDLKAFMQDYMDRIINHKLNN
ncbi:arylsulfatase [Capnocytophaga sp. oral taxon 412 str. F0487]|uniref:LTA synthase family protein n=1 Tax=Capnocytophaga sp. oral taxon 412 TaxID=712218 RepID=UPI0002696DBF|nr:LTA synthase family protein [Capnocytophaga sp. oral taxon 412]EIW90808.1 arylsulfatase [Capnocytophaga sp. oral taxon 412 str. F0487]